MSDTERFDVIVVGGGPGGSTAATLIARCGHRVLLLDKAHFPRYQIGESLLPSTVHGVCPMLGVTEQLATAGFQVKRGGTFRWGANPEPWTFTFALSRKLAGPTSYAYQVDRERFDKILLDNARDHGVDVREEHDVAALTSTGGRVDGVTYRDASGQTRLAEASYVVVAAGNTDVLHKQVGQRIYSDFFRNVALFGYFEGGRRLPAPNQGNILTAAFADGWFWYIPLSDTLTSVGAVISRERAAVLQQDRAVAMSELIASCPLIADYLCAATRVTEGIYGTLRVRKDYSYCNTQFWAPGVVLVGDAACFVDPVFSSGVHLATYSGVLAARSINSALAGLVAEDIGLREFERRYRREFGVFYEFLQSMYDINQDESSYFWTARKILDGGESDAEAFASLVAGVAGPDQEIFDLSGAGGSAKQFGKALEEATGILDAGDIVFNGPGTRLLGTVLQESGSLQMQAALADMPDAPTPAALFPDGLVPTVDGLHWSEP